jgi:DNA recombination protein RmuC
VELVFLAAGLAIGIIAAYLIAKLKFSNSNIPEAEDMKLQINTLINEKGIVEERNSITGKSLEQSKADLAAEREKVIQLNSGLSKLSAINSNLEQRLGEQKSEMEELQKKFVSEFENLANKILDDKSKKFTEKNKENLDVILNPLKEKISDFEKRVNEVYINETRERASLAEQIKNLHELNRQMTEEANNLTKALKGDTKTQGAWGEFILERILEKSGLERGREFLIQETVKNEDGTMLRPDIIIRLPEEKSMIIDSKISLTSYELYSSSENNDEKKKFLNEHIASVRRHIKLLSPKDYQNMYGIQSLDFVLMFIPIEPAFALSVQYDPNLFYDAFEKNIVIVSPTTLLATLRTISSIWKQEKQNRNAMEIAKQSGALYDKFVGFVEDLINIGRKLDSTKDSYSEAMRKLHEGSGNLIRRVEHIKQLGVKPTKSLPPSILDRAQDGELFEGMDV